MNVEKIAKNIQSLRDLVVWGVAEFEKAGLAHVQGMPEAVDEAVYLGLHALGLAHDCDDEAVFDAELSMSQKMAVLNHYKQRIESRRPAAYITHEAWFAGLQFYVDERVLIPRSPIAELIETHFSPWIDTEKVNRILDLCTGSGCIAIACAEYFEMANVVASDISPEALEVAAINVQKHGLGHRVHVQQSSLFEAVPKQRYDIIVGNPPYVSEQEMQSLPVELTVEPVLGLAAGKQGLDIVIPMLQQARQYLSDDGILVVEVGYSQPALEQCYPAVPFFWFDFEYGGDGVFMLTAEQLDTFQDLLMNPKL